MVKTPFAEQKHTQLDTISCSHCGTVVLMKKGNIIAFRKSQKGQISDVVVEVADSAPFLFTCNNCGIRQLPMITLRMPKEKGDKTHVSIAGQ